MTKLLENMRLRARLLRAVRSFFDAEGFVEVTTPTAIDAPAPEEFIESLSVSNGTFLRCSPELAMKMLLASGMERIYQLGPCFRAGEHGRRHREEFTMLEYYAANWDYRRLLDFTFQMIRTCATELFGVPELTFNGELINLDAPEVITVAEAFERFAGMSCFEAERRDVFDELMVTKIEPELGRGRLTFLVDYPAARASLARLKVSDPAFAERWELYAGGLELANAFGELTDGDEQKVRFRRAAEFRSRAGMLEYPEPERFYRALEAGLPESSGSAVGFDRLAMIFFDADDIAQVHLDNAD